MNDMTNEMPPIEAGHFPASLRPLYPGCPGLFLQTPSVITHLAGAATLAREEGIGVVFSLDGVTQRVRRVRELARAYRKQIGPLDHVFFDAALYAGNDRVSGAHDLNPEWIKAQFDEGVTVALTDSPYIPEGDENALTHTLRGGRELCELGLVLTVLPLHSSWLSANIETLIAAVNAAGIPVGLVLEHASDPFGVQSVVAGSARVLAECTVPVAVLRCDLSAIGAVAFGATLGAVGTTTGQRHLFPVAKKAGGGRRASVAAFVPWPMCYRSLTTIIAAMDADRDHNERWTCPCRMCAGLMLNQIVSEEQAYRHSLAAIAKLGETTLHGTTLLQHQHAWIDLCRDAQLHNEYIAGEIPMNWETPAFIKGWVKVGAQLPPLTPAEVG